MRRPWPYVPSRGLLRRLVRGAVLVASPGVVVVPIVITSAGGILLLCHKSSLFMGLAADSQSATPPSLFNAGQLDKICGATSGNLTQDLASWIAQGQRCRPPVTASQG